MNFKEYLGHQANLINRALDELLPDPGIKPQVLHQAMRYSVFAGGKRLRPVLFLATLDALGQPGEPLMPFACALELIHTYSLIHDDLPAMDDDDFRRGLPTCHKKFGEAQAILAGDALLTYAFNLMVQPGRKGILPERLLAAVDEVAFRSGIKGMIVGQVVDIESESKTIDLDELRFIHRHKTGALFRACVCSAAILAGAGDKEGKKLEEYADQLGLAFQITDDILDRTGDEKKLGKPVGSDAKKKKATYPSLLGLDRSQDLAREAVRKAIDCLADFTSRADPLREMARAVINREN